MRCRAGAARQYGSGIMSSAVPDKPTLAGLEEKWGARWEAAGTFRFDRDAKRDQVYSIDTPPLTVSGSLHIGHVFSFTHTDTMARYKRMRGCRSSIRWAGTTTGWPRSAGSRTTTASAATRRCPTRRDSFRRPPAGWARDSSRSRCRARTSSSCARRWSPRTRRPSKRCGGGLGLSVDWTQYYTTIGEAARRASQRGFLRMLARGEAYSAEAPTLWDVDFQTAVAQAELEDRERPGAYYRLVFHPDRTAASCSIDTTRPELLPACVAVVAHPDDARFVSAVGGTVRTPVFDVEVPVAGPSPGPTRQGHRRGHGLHLRRHDRRGVVAGAGPAGAGHRRSRRPPARQRLRPAWAAGRGERVRVGAGRAHGSPGPGAGGRAALGSRRPAWRAAAHPARGQVLREGRPAPGDRDQPAVVLPDAASCGRPCSNAAGSSAGTRPTWKPATPAGSRGSTRTG